MPFTAATCAVDAAMRRAEEAWHQAPAAQNPAEIRAELDGAPLLRQIVRAALQ